MFTIEEFTATEKTIEFNLVKNEASGERTNVKFFRDDPTAFYFGCAMMNRHYPAATVIYTSFLFNTSNIREYPALLLHLSEVIADPKFSEKTRGRAAELCIAAGVEPPVKTLTK